MGEERDSGGRGKGVKRSLEGRKIEKTPPVIPAYALRTSLTRHIHYA